MARKPIPAEGAGGDVFARQVRDALAHLYDPAYLQTHSLAALVPADLLARTSGRGKALRQILVEAIDATRPIGKTDDALPGSLIHRLLTLRYVEALEPAEVQERLAVGRSEYYREHQKGLDAVVSLLRERWGSEGEPTIRPGSLQSEAGGADVSSVAAPRPNLPAQATSFIGRERERAALGQLLPPARLVTLTGAGGCGKTRLALQIAADVADSFPDGVWFVDLAPLTDPLLVVPTVMTTLGMADVPHRSPLTELADFLRRRTTLLILDNCEHLVDACARLVEALIQACPDAKVLATSREALGVNGELVWRVPSLSLPDPQEPCTVDAAGRAEAVQLFVQRARLVQPEFVLTDANAGVLAQICRRIDGIPFAIELAAARTRVLTVAQIAVRLDDRFRFLTGGKRTALLRHQTLRALVDWSYELLTDGERRLLRRLAVFAGGWTLEAAEVVGAGDGVPESEVLDLLSALVDKSLVVAESEGEHERYRLLETLREYALDKLAASGEVGDVRARHSAFYLALAGQASRELGGPRFRFWLGWMRRELNNVRAALRCAIDAGEVEQALSVCGQLVHVLYLLSQSGEARRWLTELLALPAAATPTLGRGRALVSAGRLAWDLLDLAEADARLDEALAIFRASDDRAGVGWTLETKVRVALARRDYPAAREMAEEAIEIGEAIADHFLADDPIAFPTQARLCLALAHLYLGEYPAARRWLSQVTALYASSGYSNTTGPLDCLGHIETACGNYKAARACYVESMRLRLTIDRKIGIAFTLSGFAGLAAAEGDLRRAVRLSGAAARLCELSGLPSHRTQEGYIRDRLPGIRAALGDTAYDTAWDEGQAMTQEEAVADALGRVAESAGVQNNGGGVTP